MDKKDFFNYLGFLGIYGLKFRSIKAGKRIMDNY